MPEFLSVHGRCPRCSQVLTVPAGQLQNVFRCARCQYRAAAAALVEEARGSPPRLASNHAGSALSAFDEDSDDQQTRVLLPGGPDEESEFPLPAILIADGATSSRPPPPSPALQRFDAVPSDAEDQQTRLHVPGSRDLPPAAPAPQRPVPAAAGRPAPRSAPNAGRSSRDATLLGIPGPALTRFDRLEEDTDDQHTRLHLPDQFAPPLRSSPLASGPQRSPGPVRDQTLIGVAPAAGVVARPPVAPAEFTAPELQRFDRVEEDAEDQHTRLVVPISYEEEGEPAPDLRSPVAPRPVLARSADEQELWPPGVVERWGRLALQLSRSLDDWLHERRSTLLLTLSALSVLVGPALDAVFGGPRHGTTVIVSNLVLFFLWTLGFAWLGKLKNEFGAWDPSVAGTRFWTALRLALEDAVHFAHLPGPLRYRVLGELSGGIGMLGLAVASTLTISQLVWNWPSAGGGLLTGRVWGGALVAISVIALRRAASVPVGFVAPPEIAAPAVAHFPAVLDLSVPLSLPAPNGMTPLHQVLEVLAEWQPHEWPNQDSYQAVLERHFLRHMSWTHIERDRWFGTQRGDGVAHFIVNESLLVEVVRGFDADTAERLNVRMRAHAKLWRGKPALIVVFDASRPALFSGAGTPKLEALHRNYPMLTVRMPSARLSLA